MFRGLRRIARGVLPTRAEAGLHSLISVLLALLPLALAGAVFLAGEGLAPVESVLVGLSALGYLGLGIGIGHQFRMPFWWVLAAPVGFALWAGVVFNAAVMRTGGVLQWKSRAVCDLPSDPENG